METRKMIWAAMLALVLVLLYLLSWEYFWRSKGFIPTYNDDKALWAKERKDVYQPANDATVFIGSSRVKFDLDIPTWEQRTGEEAVQLALVGTSPILVLHDLATDEDFKGKLVIDVTEVLFFSNNPAFHQSAKESTAYYAKQSPSEKVSSAISLALESRLVFLEEKKFSMNTLLTDLEIPNRPGVFSFPPFPKGFDMTTADRQTYMAEKFLADSSDLKWQTDIWEMLIMGDPTPPLSGDPLADVIKEIKISIDKIRDRGGHVIFIRTPSSGPLAEWEKKNFPRDKYWDHMLEVTDTDGIHFEDYPETKDLICPEWSHLSLQDAIYYTIQLINQLQEKGWFADSIVRR